MAPRARLLRPRRGSGLPRARSVRARDGHAPVGRLRLGARASRDRLAPRRPPARPGRDRRHLRRRRPRLARATCGRSATAGGGADVRVHLVNPTSFNDAQEVADRFKHSTPVILNLQTTDSELAKRLIDFASGLTYALDGGMQKVAEKTFMLTPRNVEVSAEQTAQLVEKAFFNQSYGSAPRIRVVKLGFCGAGNMAAAMARGWARSGIAARDALLRPRRRAGPAPGRGGRRRDARRPASLVADSDASAPGREARGPGRRGERAGRPGAADPVGDGRDAARAHERGVSRRPGAARDAQPAGRGRARRDGPRGAPGGRRGAPGPSAGARDARSRCPRRRSTRRWP